MKLRGYEFHSSAELLAVQSRINRSLAQVGVMGPPDVQSEVWASGLNISILVTCVEKESGKKPWRVFLSRTVKEAEEFCNTRVQVQVPLQHLKCKILGRGRRVQDVYIVWYKKCPN